MNIELQNSLSSDVLTGCILSSPTAWPGLVQVLEVASEEQAELLQQMPGRYSYRGNPKKKIPQGFYIPQSLTDAGKYPGLLEGYPMDAASVTPYGNRILRPHQRRSVSFIRQCTPQREGIILGADMGLGKVTMSLQAFYLDGLLELPGIICGPLSAAAAWCGETSDPSLYFGMNIFKVRGKKNPQLEDLLEHKHIYINYDILAAWSTWITTVLKPAWVIFDEIHLLMHATAARSEEAAKLSRWHTIQRRLGLTGTPIPKYRMDLWNTLRCVQPRQWGDKAFIFGCRYCNGHREIAAGNEESERTHFIYDEDTNNVELRSRLAGTLLWYNRYEVPGALPELTRRVIELEFTNEELTEYIEASNNIKAYLKKTGELVEGATTVEFQGQTVKVSKKDNAPKALRLRAISKMMDILSTLKSYKVIDELIKICTEHDRIVVFTWRRATAKYIVEELKLLTKGKHRDKKYPRLPAIYGPVDGSMTQPKRQKLAVQFSEDSYGIYVATLGAAGISINELSAASAVLFVDLHWNPSTLTQAESRIHRDGSLYTDVESIYMVARNTLDDLFIKHLIDKAAATANLKTGDPSSNLVAELSMDPVAISKESLDQICSLLAEDDN